MEHARDAEEAQERVQLGRGRRHAGREVAVEALRVEARDLVVLPAVVADDLAGRAAEAGEVAGPGADVVGVQGFGDSGVVDGESRRVPG